jgi:hypothetical protein
MLIIAEDFVGGTMIAHWQAGQTQTGFRQNLMRRLRRGALGALVFEALAQGVQDGFGQRFASGFAQLPGEPVGFGVLDANRHV